MKPLPKGIFLEWNCETGHAFVPNNKIGHEWIKEANRIWELPDNETTVALWDDHSIELENIGGYWL
jgi:hypothetical protein